MKNETTSMELNTSSGSANGTNKQNYSKERVENVQIKDTPFVARRLDENWTVTVGNYKIASGLKTLEECEAVTKDTSWHTLTTVMQAIVEANMPEGQRNELYAKIQQYEKDNKEIN